MVDFAKYLKKETRELMDLEFLNNMASKTEAEEGEIYVPHPCGTFNGTIASYAQKTKDGRPVWEFFIRTAHGTANHSRWGFSAENIENAKKTQEDYDRVMNTIKRAKRLFVDCEVWKHSEATSKTWNDLLGAWGQLVGKACQIAVKPNQKKPGYTITFINAPRPDMQDVVDVEQVTPPPKTASANVGSLPQNTVTGTVSNRKPPGSGNLDDIPF